MEKPDFTPTMEFCATNGHMGYAGIHQPVETRQDRNLDSSTKIGEIMESAAEFFGAVLRTTGLCELVSIHGTNAETASQEVVHLYP